MATSPLIKTISAQEATRMRADVAGRNRKAVPEPPPFMKRAAKASAIHVYNVGPDGWLVQLGSLGAYTILPCEPGERYRKSLSIDAIVFETVPDGANMNKMNLEECEGEVVAQDIVGIGPFKSPQNSREKWGVFVSYSDPPTEEELERAEGMLRSSFMDLVREARMIHGQGPAEAANISARMRMAAERLGLNEPWAARIREMVDCPNCGLPTSKGAARCSHAGCGAIIDEEKARRFFPELYKGKRGAGGE